MPYTKVLFESRSIVSETNKNGDRSIKATKKINEGSLLLVEQILAANLTVASIIVRFTPELFNTLTPRTNIDRKELLKDHLSPVLKKLIMKKIEKNTFKGPGTTFYLGNRISNFNHKAQPNAIVVKNDVDSIDTCFTIIAIKNIDIGEEITISYGHFDNNSTHSFMDSNIDTNESFEYLKKNKHNNGHPLSRRIIQQAFEKNGELPCTEYLFRAIVKGEYKNGWELHREEWIQVCITKKK